MCETKGFYTHPAMSTTDISIKIPQMSTVSKLTHTHNMNKI